MKFRPLCIDHHLRAQDFLLAKRDAEIRKAASLILPHRASLHRRRRRDGCGIHGADDDLDVTHSKNYGDKSDDDNSGEDFGRDNESARHSDEEEFSSSNDGDSPSSGTDSLTGSADEKSSEKKIFIEPKSSIKNSLKCDFNNLSSKEREKQILQLLGPAVHLDECVLRPISPVTKGPVRNQLLPVDGSCNVASIVLKKILENSNDNCGRDNGFKADDEIELDAVFFESGRSRFSNLHERAFWESLFDETGNANQFFYRQGCGSGDHHEHENNSFSNTMKSLYQHVNKRMIEGETAQSLNMVGSEDERLQRDTCAWKDHIQNIEIPTPMYLRHEPDHDIKELTCRHKTSIQESSLSVGTNFSVEIMTVLLSQRAPLPKHCVSSSSDKTRHSTLRKKNGLVYIVNNGKDSDVDESLAAMPKFVAENFASSPYDKMKEVDYCSRGISTPFHRFLDDDDGKPKEQENDQEMPLLIRLDPDIEKIMPETPRTRCVNIEYSRRQLDSCCTADTVINAIKAPRRFERGHESSDRSSLKRTLNGGSIFRFIDDFVKEFEDYCVEDKSIASFLPFFEASCIRNCDQVPLTPMKLRMESNLHHFYDIDQDDESGDTAQSSINKYNPPNLPLCSDLLASSKLNIFTNGSGNRRMIKPQKRFVQSSLSILRIHGLTKIAGPNKAACLFLPQIKIRKNAGSSKVMEEKRHEQVDAASLITLVAAVRKCVHSSYIPNETDLDLLKTQCTEYPVSSWFYSKDRTDSDRNTAGGNSTLDSANFLRLKKRKFCIDAIARSDEEGHRTILLTGCSSKKNYLSVYCYRGFLTNQQVSAEIFQTRYLAMLKLNESCPPKAGPSLANQAKANYTGEVWNIIVQGSIRQKRALTAKTKNVEGKKRGAPFSHTLRTKRHNQLYASCKSTSNVTQPKTTRGVEIYFPLNFDTLLSSFQSRSEKEEVACRDNSTIESLGRDALRVRGELLHLVSKSHEVAEEEKTFFAEYAVVNRMQSPRHEPFDELSNDMATIDQTTSQPCDEWDCCSTVNELSGKRKVRSELTSEEVKLENKKKKKRKKDKKKRDKKKGNKLEKRKFRDEPIQPEYAVGIVASKKKHQPMHHENISQNDHPVFGQSFNSLTKVTQPIMPIGMTPIVAPKINDAIDGDIGNVDDRIRTQEPEEVSPTNNIFTSCKKNASPHSTIASSDKSYWESNVNDELPSTKPTQSGGGGSPDSVAILNAGGRRLFNDSENKTHHNNHNDNHNEVDEEQQNSSAASLSDFKNYSQNDAGQSPLENMNSSIGAQAQESICLGGSIKNTHTRDEQIDQNLKDMGALTKEKFSTISGEEVTNDSPLILIASERFLERFGEVITEIASGRWLRALADKELKEVKNAAADRVYEVKHGRGLDLTECNPKRITVCDCPLVDIAGADIELADSSAIVVECLSSWTDGSTSSDVAQKGARAFMRRLVLLAASGRYASIHVILCLDIDVSGVLSSEIFTLQNALIQQSGCFCEDVSFEYVAPRTLPSSIAFRASTTPSSHQSHWISNMLHDENVIERARFLLNIVPTMSVHMALSCLRFSGGSSDEESMGSGHIIQNLLKSATTLSREDFIQKSDTRMSSVCADQLWLALNVDISHAY